MKYYLGLCLKESQKQLNSLKKTNKHKSTKVFQKPKQALLCGFSSYPTVRLSKKSHLLATKSLYFCLI